MKVKRNVQEKQLDEGIADTFVLIRQGCGFYREKARNHGGVREAHDKIRGFSGNNWTASGLNMSGRRRRGPVRRSIDSPSDLMLRSSRLANLGIQIEVGAP